MALELEPIRLEGVSEERPLIIAGPCSAETEEQVMSTAKQLANNGTKIFRAGIWKPRTKPGGFEGVGVDGLAWLKEVKKETGMYVSTEVATAKHVYECLKAGIDILWIGARTTANPFAVQEIADALKGVDIPVYVKNPVNPDLELWIGAMERINNAGIKRLGAIHRGFSSYDKKIYRNLPQWHIPIELRRRIPNLPILCDPSHIGGKRELIASLCQQAMDLGFDGLIVESPKKFSGGEFLENKSQCVYPGFQSPTLAWLFCSLFHFPFSLGRLKVIESRVKHIVIYLYLVEKGVNSMPKKKETTTNNTAKKIRPATTPEARENQLISLAVDLAERQLLEGTASSQVITHYLKLGSTKEKIEREILEKQKMLIEAKTENLQSSKRIEELYTNAINAMKSYSGQNNSSDEDDEEVDEYEY